MSPGIMRVKAEDLTVFFYGEVVPPGLLRLLGTLIMFLHRRPLRGLCRQ